MNPFEQKVEKLDSTIMDWQTISSKPYDKMSVDPFTKCRIILANGAEFEAVNFSHRFSRSCPDNDLRRELALIRRSEQQQQKRISLLKPHNETILETTIGYEQLAVELTAILATRENDEYVKEALDFALLEDFDHLYRYADLLELDTGVKAERLVGKYTEIMPGRPTISEHRYPLDDVKRYTNSKQADLLTTLNISIITAAEQQTMNYYMNVAGFYDNKIGRDLFSEIAMIEEQHVTQYGSLLDTKCTFLEQLLMHEYTECYLYYSLYKDEKDKDIQNIWLQTFEQELSHLFKAVELLNHYENKEWQQVISKGEFPELLTFSSNIDYVRSVLAKTVDLTGKREDYISSTTLDAQSDFHKYQKTVNSKTALVPSHKIISKYIADKDTDYRFMTMPHPIIDLRDRKVDNTTVGRYINEKA